MLVRQEFQEMPPKPFLMQILDKISKIYIFLWENKDRMNKINVSWNDISRIYNKNNFRSSLRRLNNEGLLDYNESKDGVLIELVDWNDLNEE
jgi:hypothetical protein